MTQMDLFPELTPSEPSSQPVIPANRFHTQVSASDIKMTATSGRTSCKLLHTKDPLSAFSKMFMVTSQWASTKCFLTWKPKATPAGRLLFQLAVSMRPTEETESGLLHTPTDTANQMAPSMVAKGSGWMWATPAAADSVGTTGGGQGKSLRTDVKMWPTPTAAAAGEGQFLETLVDKDGNPPKRGQRVYNPATGNHAQVTLNRAVKLWPTPDTRGFTNQGSLEMLSKKATTKEEFDGMAYRKSKVFKDKMWPTPTAHNAKEGAFPAEYTQTLCATATESEGKPHSSGSLNPAWVEWLMGYPSGWTDLGD